MAVNYKNVKMKNKKTGKMETINPFTPEELAAQSPQVTQKGTGENKAMVKNKQGVWESPFTEAEQIANKQILKGQSQQEIDKALLASEKANVTPTNQVAENLPAEQGLLPGQEEIPTVKSIFKENLNGEKKTPKQVLSTLQDITAVELKPVAQVYDFVQSLFSGGKSIEQKMTESNFADVKASINNNLNLLSQGIGDADTIRKDIMTAERINAEFESSAKKFSNKNLRYYLTDGKDILIQSELNKDSIANWKMQLAAAEQQATLKRLRGAI